MYNEQIDYERLRARVEQRIKRRAKFYKDLVAFIGVNFVLWMVWGWPILRDGGSLQGGGTPWPLFVTFFWGIALVSDAIKAFFDFDKDTAFDREMQREIRRERRRMYGTDDDLSEKPKRSEGNGENGEKSKREQTVRLSDDGELIYEDDELRPGTRSSR
jgi:hypothetical protein